MLRVGVMLESYVSSAWIAAVVEQIQSSEFARVELVVLHSSVAVTKPSLGGTLFRQYEQWDFRRNRLQPDALEPVDLKTSLDQTPSLTMSAPSTGEPDGMLAEAAEYNLDVLLYFGERRLHGPILKAARYGVWAFQPGDVTARDGAPLFRELRERNPVTQSRLYIVGDSAAQDRTIYQSLAATDQQSLFRSRNAVYWKTAEFAMRRLRDLHQDGIESIYVDSAMGDAGPDYRIPTAAQMFRFMANYIFRWAGERTASLQSGPRSKWCIGIRPRSEGRRFDDPANYALMLSDNDRFHADPFLVEKGSKTFLFFEDFRFSLGRAILSCCELDANGAPGRHVEILRRPYHLSYPYVFEDGGEMYMIPETRGNRSLELYRATNFPYEWTLDTLLMSDVDVVDATVQVIDGKYWMFAGVSNGRFSTCDELGLFFSDALRGPWTLHPKTPLISDVMRARPAGKLFYDDGRLIRPSQDCSKAYGYALVFSEITKLSETDYEEQFISRLKPEVIEGSFANHTYNRSERFEVTDRTLRVDLATTLDSQS